MKFGAIKLSRTISLELHMVNGQNFLKHLETSVKPKSLIYAFHILKKKKHGEHRIYTLRD